ncbi:DUF2285 domain-containing protein [Mesorhizobium sp. M1050]
MGLSPEAWRPDCTGRNSFPPRRAAPPFDLTALPCRTSVLLTGDAANIFCCGAPTSISRLSCLALAFCCPSDSISTRSSLPPSRSTAAECLNSLSAHGLLPKRLFPPEARGLHLRFALQPLDGSIGGASHREIAEALIGEPRVQADFIAIICVTASAAPFGAAVCS